MSRSFVLSLIALVLVGPALALARSTEEEINSLRRNCEIVMTADEPTLVKIAENLIRTSADVVVRRDTRDETVQATIALMKKSCRATLKMSRKEMRVG